MTDGLNCGTCEHSCLGGSLAVDTNRIDAVVGVQGYNLPGGGTPVGNAVIRIAK